MEFPRVRSVLAFRGPSRCFNAPVRKVSTCRVCCPLRLQPLLARNRRIAGLHRASRGRTLRSCLTKDKSTLGVSPVTSSSHPGVDGQPNVIQVLESRGLIDAVTSPEIYTVCARPVAVYVGFDPTADSLHLGNLLGLLVLRWFQRLGHRPVAIIGGATARIGDPSGKRVERPLLDASVIEQNALGIAENLRQVLEFRDDALHPTEPLILNNHHWLGDIRLLDFLRDVGKLARVGTMLSKESVRLRMQSEEGLSFTEFTYQLLQGYDFAYLYRNHGVLLQAGGSDQWGNIVAGLELTRKLYGGTVHGLTFPLLTTKDGKKLGKTEKGAVWLSPKRLSPYEFYQYLFKVADEDVCAYLRKLTFLPLHQIDELEQALSHPEQSGYLPNTAQKLLAAEVTRIVHGDKGVETALAATAVAAPGHVPSKDSKGNSPLRADVLEAVSSSMPNATLSRSALVGATLVDVMVRAGLQKTKSEARRLIANGGAYLNDEKVNDHGRVIDAKDLLEGRLLLLAAGKKNKMLVRVVDSP